MFIRFFYCCKRPNDSAKIAAAFQAITDNDRDALFHLLYKEKLNPNARKTDGGWTLLQHAIHMFARRHNPRGRGLLSRDSMIELILQAKASPDDFYTKGNHRISALHLAAQKNLPEVYSLLLAYCANATIRDEKMRTPDYYKKSISPSSTSKR